MSTPKTPGRIRSWLARVLRLELAPADPPKPAAPKHPPRARLSYDAAKRDRRHTWQQPGVATGTDAPGATTELKSVRDVVRALRRNDPHAKAAIDSYRTGIVGTGITASCDTGDAELDKKAEDLIADWWEVCVSDGQIGAIGYQQLASDAITESGEIFVRKRIRRETDNLPIRLQLEPIEADQCDETMTQSLPANGRIVQGIEHSGSGRRVAYHFHREHPGSSLASLSAGTVRIRARDIAHAFRVERPGQVRGMSWLSSIAVRLGIVSDYDIASLDRRRGESAICFSVEDMNGEGDAGNAFGPQEDEDGNPINEWDIMPAVDASGNEVERVTSGGVVYLAPGKKLNQHAPASVGGYAEHRQEQLASIAAGLEMAYVVLTKDWRKTNFSSAKAADQKFQEAMAATRDTMFVRNVCQRPLWDWPIEVAILQGLLPEFWPPGTDRAGQRIRYRARWSPPKFRSLDPLKDAQAIAIQLANKLISWGDVIRRDGGVPDDVLADFDKWAKKINDLGHKPPWNAGYNPGGDESGDEPDEPNPDEDEPSEDEPSEDEPDETE